MCKPEASVAFESGGASSNTCRNAAWRRRRRCLLFCQKGGGQLPPLPPPPLLMPLHSITKSPFNQFSFFVKTSQIKWTVPNDFLAKKEHLFFYEDLRPVVASIKEGLPVLRLTIVLSPRVF